MKTDTIFTRGNIWRKEQGQNIYWERIHSDQKKYPWYKFITIQKIKISWQELGQKHLQINDTNEMTTCTGFPDILESNIHFLQF